MPTRAETTGAEPPVTVAVCTRDRPDDLARCLDALQALRYPRLELLVVDNAPRTDATQRLVAGRAGVRYLREPRPGLDRARNRALGEASGELIAFTDDDVVVDAEWVSALTAVFRYDPQAGAVTGLVEPLELETEAQRLFERYRSFARGGVRARAAAGPADGSLGSRYGMTGSFGTGANMAFRREVLAQLGGFDPSLGAGMPTRGGDDLDIFFRVLKAGWALVYEPAAVVRHRHRREMDALVDQIRDHGVSFSSYVVRVVGLHPDERWAFARLWTWWAAKTCYRVVRPRSAPAAPMRRLALAELEGLVRGLGRYHQARTLTRNG
ncbi:MAG: glycosyltransferase family 2 protein [Gemmatimonadales bacterium]